MVDRVFERQPPQGIHLARLKPGEKRTEFVARVRNEVVDRSACKIKVATPSELGEEEFCEKTWFPGGVEGGKKFDRNAYSNKNRIVGKQKGR